MEAEERRNRLMRILRDRQKPVPGSKLADELGVSRQIIVSDIALLRAAGAQVFATSQGYILTAGANSRVRQVFACQHSREEAEDELLAIVEAGGKVIDVIVDHPLYGDLRGLLMLSSNGEVRDWAMKYLNSGAELLSALTKGVHLHTVEADNADVLARVGKALKDKGFLLTANI